MSATNGTQAHALRASIPPPTSLPLTIEGLEQYTERTGHLHPALIAVLQRFFFFNGVEYDLQRVTVQVRPKDWLWFKLSGRGSPTPAFTYAETVYCKTGWMICPGETDQRASLNTSLGWNNLAHELFHAYQWTRDGRGSMWWQYVAGVWNSWRQTGKLWAHEIIPLEQQAIAFGQSVQRIIAAWPEEFWDLARQIRGW